MEQKQIQVNFRLVDLHEVQFVKLVNEWPEGEIQIGNQLNFSSVTDKRLVHCTASFEYKKNDITLLILTVQSVFEFAKEGWSAMYQLQGDEWVLPAGLVQHLADVTIGAARGILALRSQENDIPRLILPLMNSAQFINNNLALPRQTGANLSNTPSANA